MPRIGLAWRPLPASSLVVHAGYGIYYNTSVYQSIANQMAQQSPLSNSLSIANIARQSVDAGERIHRARRSHDQYFRDRSEFPGRIYQYLERVGATRSSRPR